MFKINRIGCKYVHNRGIIIDRPSGSRDFLLVIFRTPAYVSEKERDKFEYIKRPSVIIYDYGSNQQYHSDVAFANDFIHFKVRDKSEFYDLLKYLDLPLNTLFAVHDLQYLSGKVQDMMNLFYSNANKLDERMDFEFKSLLYSLSDMYKNALLDTDLFYKHRTAFDAIRRSIFIYNENTDYSVTALAESLNLSVSYFQHIYKNLYGNSVVSDVINSRIEYASNLLMNSRDSISEIASRCGYINPEHFTRQFKEKIGVTPKEYRNKALT